MMKLTPAISVVILALTFLQQPDGAYSAEETMLHRFKRGKDSQGQLPAVSLEKFFETLAKDPKMFGCVAESEALVNGRKWFDKHDKNGDGYIAPSEAKSIHRMVNKYNKKYSFINASLPIEGFIADYDKDNRVTYVELVQFVMDPENINTENWKLFVLGAIEGFFDVNPENGLLSDDELKALHDELDDCENK